MGGAIGVARAARRAPTPSADVRIVDGHRVGVRVAGTGEPLVLLHGIGRTRADWAAVQPALAERFTTYAVDLEGFGATERFSDRLTIGGLAAVVRRTLAVLGEDRPLRIVGNSMGGAVAMRLAVDAPERTTGLVLVSSAGFGSETTFGLRLMTIRGLAPLLLRTGPFVAGMQTRAMYSDRSLATRERIEALIAETWRPGAIRNYLELVHELGGWSGIREEWQRELVAALAATRVPALVLWGEEDAVLPRRHLEAAARALPHAETRLLPGIGHAPQLQAPERFTAEVLPFLESLGG